MFTVEECSVRYVSFNTGDKEVESWTFLNRNRILICHNIKDVHAKTLKTSTVTVHLRDYYI